MDVLQTQRLLENVSREKRGQLLVRITVDLCPQKILKQ